MGPVVQLPKGKIRGHILQSENGNPYYVFQEIPYAAPPVGTNRFQVIFSYLNFLYIIGSRFFHKVKQDRIGKFDNWIYFFIL